MSEAAATAAANAAADVITIPEADSRLRVARGAETRHRSIESMTSQVTVTRSSAFGSSANGASSAGPINGDIASQAAALAATAIRSVLTVAATTPVLVRVVCRHLRNG